MKSRQVIDKEKLVDENLEWREGLNEKIMGKDREINKFCGNNDAPALDSNLRILVFQRFPALQRTVKGILEKLGLTNIRLAENGEKGLELLKSEEFDIIILDRFADYSWDMPGMKWREIMEAMQSNENLKRTPVIMTGDKKETKEILTGLRESTLFIYLEKPFTSEMLAKKMREAIKSRNSHRK